MLYSGALGRITAEFLRRPPRRVSAWLGVYAVVCRRVGGFVEPHPRAARARAARARSGDPPAPGEIQEKVRSRHQSRQRADGAGRARPGAVVSGPGAAVVGAVAQAGRRGRGGDVRVGQSPRGDVAVGDVRQPAGAVSSLRAGLGRRQRPAALRRSSDRDDRNLGVSRDRRPDSLHAGAAAPQQPTARDASASERHARAGGGRPSQRPQNPQRHRARAVSRPRDRRVRSAKPAGRVDRASQAASRGCAYQERGGVAPRGAARPPSARSHDQPPRL